MLKAAVHLMVGGAPVADLHCERCRVLGLTEKEFRDRVGTLVIEVSVDATELDAVGCQHSIRWINMGLRDAWTKRLQYARLHFRRCRVYILEALIAHTRDRIVEDACPARPVQPA